MWKTIVPAAAVLAAEAVIRRKINALPAETFPLRIGQRVQLRRAHNRGLLCSKFARKPRAPPRCRLRPPQRSRRWRPCAPAAGAARRCRSAWA